MRCFSAALFSLFFVLVSQPVLAQQAGSWGPLKQANGTGTGVCNNSRGSVCLYFRCSGAGKLEFVFSSSSGLFGRPTNVGLLIDGRRAGLFRVGGAASVIPYNPSQDARLIAALKGGSRLEIVTPGGGYRLSLAGSSKQIDMAIEQCKQPEEVIAASELSLSDRRERRADEVTMKWPATEQRASFKRYNDTDLWGKDIRGGLQDPLLTDMTLGQCERLCSLTSNCYFYTHNGRTNTCFLKSGQGQVKRYKDATTGEIDRPGEIPYAPPTTGPNTVIDESLSWNDADTTSSWHERLRERASSLGGDCRQEEVKFVDLISDFSAVLSREKYRVGDHVEISYQGNTLKDRIPVWLVASSDQPVRFSGSGFFALGPEAPNPFGIVTGEGKHRAFSALAARGAGETGQIRYTPLRAGPTNIELSLVTYLRACGDEVVQPLKTISMDVEPAAAQIVLNNPTGRAAYKYEIDIPEQNRRVMLSETRFLLLDRTDGTEIVERAGSNLTVSPTHRFIAVENNGSNEIIDVVDGQLVARPRDGLLLWALGDSYVVSTASPWGEVNIHSTFGDSFNLVNQVTGASCCPASEDTTHIGLDIENAIVSVWGPFGHYVGAMQNPGYALVENTGSAYSSGQSGHRAIYQRFMNSIGPVAPVSFDAGWMTVGGLKPTTTYEDHWKTGTREPRPFAEVREIQLERVGLELQPLKEVDVAWSPTTNGVLRSAGNANEVQANFESQMQRIGIQLIEMTDGQKLHMVSPEEMPASGFERIENAAPVMNKLQSEARAKGWELQWTIPEGGQTIPECYHVKVGSIDGLSNETGNYVPNDVISVSKVDMADGAIWVTRSDCSAGATYGSLRGQSGMYIYDLGRPFTGSVDQVIGMENSYMVNSRQIRFFEHEFLVKAGTRRLLTYAPGTGVISLYDRDQRRFVFVGETLPDGDLLENAWVTEDLRHIVQLNSDGGFYVHRMDDASVVLAGRIVDDEVVVWNEKFQFDATAEAASLIDLTFPGQGGQYSLDRFGSALRVEGVSQYALTSRPVRDAAPISVPPALSGSIALSAEGKIRIAAEFETGTVATLNIFQDGVLTNERDIEGTVADASFSVDRLKDARWVTVLATDAQGLASLPVSADLGPVPEQVSRQRALIIGINTYDDPDIPSLNYALRDGGRFAATLADKLEDAPHFDITYLKDTRATPEAIRNNIRTVLDGLEKGDHAVFYFAGHGLRSMDGEFFLGTSGTRSNDLAGTALAFSDVAYFLQASEARITVILDACHAGFAGLEVFATNDDIVSGLEDLNSNLTVLSAAKGRQFSEEAVDVGGGVFTVALEQVLATDRSQYDANNNGRIEASELYSGVKSLVISRRKGLQTPWLSQSRMVGDYALF